MSDPRFRPLTEQLEAIPRTIEFARKMPKGTADPLGVTEEELRTFLDEWERFSPSLPPPGGNGANPDDVPVLAGVPAEPVEAVDMGPPDLPEEFQDRETRTILKARKSAQTRKKKEELVQKSLADCIPPSGFLRDFVDLYRPTTEAPEVFHVAAALSTVSTALGRAVWLDNGPHRIFPNVYLALCAESTWLRKSTSLREAEAFLRRLGEAQGEEARYLLALPMTINSLYHWKQRPLGLVTHDEFGAWLRMAERTPYMSGLKAAITRLYDCPNRLEFLFKGKEERVILEKPCISLLVATTLDWFSEAVSQADIGSGYLPRFLFVCAGPDDAGKPLPRPPGPDQALMERADSTLSSISKMIGSVKLSQEATDLFDSWYVQNAQRARSGDDRMVGFRGRLADYVLKLSILYQASQDQDLVVTGDCMGQAVDLATFLIGRTERMVREELSLSRARALCDRILRLLRKAGETGLTTK